MGYACRQMSASRILLDESFAINSRYRVVLYAAQVSPSKKFPSGVKAKFVLIDSDGGFARLLIDNHEPFGFHMHSRLPEDEAFRVPLPVADHNAALDLFFEEVERIVNHERS